MRKYSIGAASALIGFMALANGQAVQADEAQSISDLTDASNQAQALKRFQQLSWRLQS
ncbi:MAG: YSIRK-type signal peptide-containing protein [Streptococcus sp.]